MSLSNELISQFAKITNDNKKTRVKEATLYGTVLEYEDSICVKFDGASEITPVTTITEKDESGNITNYKYGAASVKTGDRVSVSLKNHSATITGNLSDPPMGRAEVKVTDDSILAIVDDKIKVQIDAVGVKIDGIAEFTNSQYSELSDGLANGTTIINGGCIKTGTIDAERLNLTGAITFGDLSSDAQGKINTAQSTANSAQSTANTAQSTANSAQTAASNAQSTANSASSTASSALSTANSAQSTANQAYNKAYDLDDIVSDWGYTYRGTTYIDGEMIYTGTVTASKLQGGEVILLDADEDEAAAFFLTGAASYDGGALRMVSGAIEINSLDGDIFIEDGGGYYVHLDASAGVIKHRGECSPAATNRYPLGYSNLMWSDVYVASGEISTSDETKKKDIVRDLSGYNVLFDKLVPCSYKLIDGASGRTHLGMIAQDIEKSMDECGVSSLDFAGFIKTPRRDDEGKVIEDEYDYALRYSEFIPMLIWQVQKLKARVAELEEAHG